MSQKTRSHKKTVNRWPVVRCKFDRMVPPTDVASNPKNDWHKHPKEQLDLYGDIIQETGFRRAAVVSRRSGLLTKGHGMKLAAIARGWSVIPIEYQDYASEHQELADMLADNKLAELAGTDEAKLRALLESLDGEIDLRIAAVTDEELQRLAADVDPGAILKPVVIKPVPRMAWCLIGIPIERWKEISGPLEAVSKTAGIEYHTSSSGETHEDQKG